MLMKTGIEFTYLKDVDFYRERKKSCYGGFSCIFNRRTVATNKSAIIEFDTSMYPISMLGEIPCKLVEQRENPTQHWSKYKNPGHVIHRMQNLIKKRVRSFG